MVVDLFDVGIEGGGGGVVYGWILVCVGFVEILFFVFGCEVWKWSVGGLEMWYCGGYFIIGIIFMCLNNKIVFIIGVSVGIGCVSVLCFVVEGVKLVFNVWWLELL